MSASQSISPQCLGFVSLLEQAELWAVEGQIARARNLYHQAIKQDTTGFARLRFGAFLYQTGWLDEARSEFSEALETARRQQNPHLRAEACQHLATLHHERGETALAMSYRQQEIAARLEFPSDFTELTPPANFLSLVNEALSKGDLDYAEQLAEHAVKFAQTQNCPGELADAWGTWGGVQSLKSNGKAAWQGLRTAYYLHCQTRDDSGRAVDLLNLAQVARQFGWWTITQRLLIKAQKIVQAAGLVELREKTERFLEEANRVLGVADRTPEWN